MLSGYLSRNNVILLLVATGTVGVWYEYLIIMNTTNTTNGNGDEERRRCFLRRSPSLPIIIIILGEKSQTRPSVLLLVLKIHQVTWHLTIYILLSLKMEWRTLRRFTTQPQCRKVPRPLLVVLCPA